VERIKIIQGKLARRGIPTDNRQKEVRQIDRLGQKCENGQSRGARFLAFKLRSRLNQLDFAAILT